MPVVRPRSPQVVRLGSPQAVRRFDGSTKLTAGQAHRRRGLSRATSRGSPQVFVRSRVLHASLLQPAIESVARKILAAAGEPGAELSLDLVGDRRMRRLNREYRGQDLPTDVLAFPTRQAAARITHQRGPIAPGLQRVPRVTPEVLGDVVISVPTAARQAAAVGHSVEHELAALLVHGVLHLCGYDHERGVREARRMRRKERAILRSLMPIPKLFRERSA